MKTVGQILKATRLKSGLTLDQVAAKTRIRRTYLDALEKDDYSKLPSATYARGFIKNYAQTLSIPPNSLLAVFRRDFEEDESGQIIPRSLLDPATTNFNIVWQPRIITGTIIGFTIALFASYLVYQYIGLIKPTLKIISPEQGALIATNLVRVNGITDPSATITVDQTLVPVSSDGSFEVDVPLETSPMTITITATSRRQHTSSIVRTVYQDSSVHNNNSIRQEPSHGAQ